MIRYYSREELQTYIDAFNVGGTKAVAELAQINKRSYKALKTKLKSFGIYLTQPDCELPGDYRLLGFTEQEAEAFNLQTYDLGDYRARRRGKEKRPPKPKLPHIVLSWTII
jgi:hypothetical protein